MSARDTQPDAAPWDGPINEFAALACEVCNAVVHTHYEHTLDRIEVVFLPTDGTLTDDPYEAYWVCVRCADINMGDRS